MVETKAQDGIFFNLVEFLLTDEGDTSNSYITGRRDVLDLLTLPSGAYIPTTRVMSNLYS